jgi:tetratricopeptide (TPR) repeat protein
MEEYKKAAMCFTKACAMRPYDKGLFKEAMSVIIEAGEYELALTTYALYKGEAAGLIDFYKVYAMAYTGSLDEALDMLIKGLDIPDYREGDDSITEVYQYIIMEKGRLEGKTIRREKIEVPNHLDFRMFNKTT